MKQTCMKKIIWTALLFLVGTVICYAQIKIIKATKQKTFGGMGGIFMNYTIGIKNKTADSLLIDSVKTITDAEHLNFYFSKTERNYCEFSFSYALSATTRCKSCPDTGNKKQPDIDKGVVVYYTKKNEKYSVRVKKFKQLADLMLP
jgi:hypothetical protein